MPHIRLRQPMPWKWQNNDERKKFFGGLPFFSLESKKINEYNKKIRSLVMKANLKLKTWFTILLATALMWPSFKTKDGKKTPSLGIVQCGDDDNNTPPAEVYVEGIRVYDATPTDLANIQTAIDELRLLGLDTRFLSKVSEIYLIAGTNTCKPDGNGKFVIELKSGLPASAIQSQFETYLSGVLAKMMQQGDIQIANEDTSLEALITELADRQNAITQDTTEKQASKQLGA